MMGVCSLQPTWFDNMIIQDFGILLLPIAT